MNDWVIGILGIVVMLIAISGFTYIIDIVAYKDKKRASKEAWQIFMFFLILFGITLLII